MAIDDCGVEEGYTRYVDREEVCGSTRGLAGILIVLGVFVSLLSLLRQVCQLNVEAVAKSLRPIKIARLKGYARGSQGRLSLTLPTSWLSVDH